MLRSLLALMLGWCVLSFAAGFAIHHSVDGYAAALYTGFGFTSVVVLLLLPAVVFMAAAASRWPRVRRAGFVLLPAFGGLTSVFYTNGSTLGLPVEVPWFLAMACGAAVGHLAERWLPKALPAETPWWGHWYWESAKACLHDLDALDLTLPPRIVTGLCLVQIIAVCVGTFATKGTLRQVRHDLNWWNPIPWNLAFVRTFGFWFLLVPLIWCGWAALSANREGGTVDIKGRQALLGVVLSVAAVVFFTYCALDGISFMQSVLFSGPIVRIEP